MEKNTNNKEKLGVEHRGPPSSRLPIPQLFLFLGVMASSLVLFLL